MRGWRAAFPPAQWLSAYQAKWLPKDAIAGVTLAAYGIPTVETHIARSEDEKSIFSDVNRQFVSDVAHAVANSLTKSLDEGGRLRLSESDLYLLIEKALLENEAYDVAKSLAFRRSLYIAQDLKAGEMLTRENLRCVRPGFGLAPKHLDSLLDAAAAKSWLITILRRENARRFRRRIRCDSAGQRIEQHCDPPERDMRGQCG